MRFVQPDTIRLPLADGHWIDVKKELTVGEDKRLKLAGMNRMVAGEVIVDWNAMAFARVLTYLVDWSAKDEKGKDRKITPQAIEALDTASFEEIDNAIKAHIEAAAQEKKVLSGSPTSTADSQ